MLSHKEAQELHECIGQGIARNGDYLVALERALELAAVLVSDTMPSPVSYDPCIQGTIEIGGRRSEFLSAVTPPNVWDLTREHPDEYEEWQSQVYNGETLRGFADWLKDRQEDPDDDGPDPILEFERKIEREGR